MMGSVTLEIFKSKILLSKYVLSKSRKFFNTHTYIHTHKHTQYIKNKQKSPSNASLVSGLKNR